MLWNGVLKIVDNWNYWFNIDEIMFWSMCRFFVVFGLVVLFVVLFLVEVKEVRVYLGWYYNIDCVVYK